MSDRRERQQSRKTVDKGKIKRGKSDLKLEDRGENHEEGMEQGA